MSWFIDCGAHRGESVRFARKLYGAPLHVVAVEPQAACWSDLAAEGAMVIPAALWTEMGHQPLYLGDYEVSSTLIAEKTTGGVSTERAETVATVTLASILRALPDGEKVTLKLDVEGAEYAVLEQALADRDLRWVDRLFVDFHADRIPTIPRERHNSLVERLLAANFPLPKWLPVEGEICDCGEKWLL